ncbi:MAG TPA: hypothetical protein PLB00_15480 [Pseudomonadota bacterium]|nr:hypothetical protein [Pseudomonadota bacterium]
MKRSSLLIAAALSVALVGTAYAQGLGGRLSAWRASAAALQIHGLSASQQDAFAQLQSRQIAFRRAAHGEIGALIQGAQQELSDPNADLRSLSQNTTRTLAALAFEANSLREERLAFYETLTAAQQSEVRAALQRRLERMARVHALVGDFLADAE